MNQSIGVDEIIVMDDCSIDDSVRTVNKKFPGIAIYSTGDNTGPGVARNIGASKCKNNVILFLDHDIELERAAIESLLKFMNRFPTYSIFVPLIVFSADTNIVQSAGTRVHYLGISLLSEHYGKHRSAVSTVEDLSAFGGGCYLENRNRMALCAEYDEIFFYALEDTDYAITQKRLGNKALLVPSAVVRHRSGSSKGLSHTKIDSRYPGRKLFLLSRNHLFLVAKHYPYTYLILCFVPGIVFSLGLIAYSFVNSTDWKAGLHGHISFFRHWNRILKFRKKTKRYAFDSAMLEASLSIKKNTYNGRFARIAYAVLNAFFTSYGKLFLRL